MSKVSAFNRPVRHMCIYDGKNGIDLSYFFEKIDINKAL